MSSVAIWNQNPLFCISATPEVIAGPESWGSGSVSWRGARGALPRHTGAARQATARKVPSAELASFPAVVAALQVGLGPGAHVGVGMGVGVARSQGLDARCQLADLACAAVSAETTFQCENEGHLLPFSLFVYQEEGDALGALTQKRGDHYSQLDPLAQGYLPGLSRSCHCPFGEGPWRSSHRVPSGHLCTPSSGSPPRLLSLTTLGPVTPSSRL